MKTIIKLIFAALIVNACVRAGAAFWRYYQFKDEVQSAALFMSARPDAEIQSRVMEVAAQLHVPVQPQDVVVIRRMNHTLINAVYTDVIEILPTKPYPWQFKVNADAFSVDMPAPVQ